VLFDPIASAVGPYLVKGKLVYVEGKLTTQKYDDKSGGTHYRAKIFSSVLKILDVEKRDAVVSEAPQTTSVPRQADDGASLFLDECPF
jgi:single-strand DNA-binding protein